MQNLYDDTKLDDNAQVNIILNVPRNDTISILSLSRYSDKYSCGFECGLNVRYISHKVATKICCFKNLFVAHILSLIDTYGCLL